MKKSTIAIGVLAAAVAIGYPTYKSMFSAPAFEISKQHLTEKFSHYAHPEHFIAAQDLKEMMDNGAQSLRLGNKVGNHFQHS